jgi:hypothetical protein
MQVAYNRVIFPKLRVKMAEVDIDITGIAERIGMNRETLSRKLSGKNDLTMPEAYKIRDNCFPDEIVDKLFDPKWKGETA